MKLGTRMPGVFFVGLLALLAGPAAMAANIIFDVNADMPCDPVLLACDPVLLAVETIPKKVKLGGENDIEAHRVEIDGVRQDNVASVPGKQDVRLQATAQSDLTKPDGSNHFIRFDLEGAVFGHGLRYNDEGSEISVIGNLDGIREAVSRAPAARPTVRLGGRAGDSWVIIRQPVTATAGSSASIIKGAKYWVKVDSKGDGDGFGIVPPGQSGADRASDLDANRIALVNDEEGDVSFSVKAYRNLNDAKSSRNPISEEHIGGEMVFIRKVSGIDVKIDSGATAVAAAASGYKRFALEGGENGGAVTLGSLRAAEYLGSILGNISLSAKRINNAFYGGELRDGDILFAGPGQIKVVVMQSGGGEKMIGKLDLVQQSGTTDALTSTECNDSARGANTNNPYTGNLDAYDIHPTTRALTQKKYSVCLNVDAEGENEVAIDDTMFTATVYAPKTAAPQDEDDKNDKLVALARATDLMLASGPIGKIERDGASVRIDYLTTYGKYNQRLIVANHGMTEIQIDDDVVFHAEEGVRAEIRSGVDLRIPAGESKTYRVRDMINIMGNKTRVAAELSLKGTSKGLVSVATTQVNLADGSTDTVMWPVR